MRPMSTNSKNPFGCLHTRSVCNSQLMSWKLLARNPDSTLTGGGGGGRDGLFRFGISDIELWLWIEVLKTPSPNPIELELLMDNLQCWDHAVYRKVCYYLINNGVYERLFNTIWTVLITNYFFYLFYLSSPPPLIPQKCEVMENLGFWIWVNFS